MAIDAQCNGQSNKTECQGARNHVTAGKYRERGEIVQYRSFFAVQYNGTIKGIHRFCLYQTYHSNPQRPG